MTKSYSVKWGISEKNFEFLKSFQGKNNIHFLEIGSFEGFTTNLLLDNFLTGSNCSITCIDPWVKYSEATIDNISGCDDYINKNTYEKFVLNTNRNKDRIIIKRGYSKDILPSLKNIYNFIYIDGDHSASAVYKDAELGFNILLVDGIVIFDDYLWGTQRKLTLILYGKILINRYPKNILEKLLKYFKDRISMVIRSEYYKKLPKYAIDKFLKQYRNKISVLAINGQVVIKKIKD